MCLVLELLRVCRGASFHLAGTPGPVEYREPSGSGGHRCARVMKVRQGPWRAHAKELLKRDVCLEYIYRVPHK